MFDNLIINCVSHRYTQEVPNSLVIGNINSLIFLLKLSKAFCAAMIMKWIFKNFQVHHNFQVQVLTVRSHCLHSQKQVLCLLNAIHASLYTVSQTNRKTKLQLQNGEKYSKISKSEFAYGLLCPKQKLFIKEAMSSWSENKLNQASCSKEPIIQEEKSQENTQH